MTIYCLLHYYGPTESTYGDVAALGCYTDLATIAEVEKKYRSISGFAHYPNGFCVVEHAVIGETDCDYEAVYLAEVYIHDNQYEFERDFCLGVFANRASAEKRMSVFQKNNVQFIGKSGLCVECMVSRYELNKMEWREGFITETT